MTEYVHYRTNFETLAKGIVLKDDDHVESTGVSGVLVECIGAAPFESQPYADQETVPKGGYEKPVGRLYDLRDAYFGYGGDDSLHTVRPDDIVERYGDSETDL